MDYSKYACLLVDIQEGIATVTLNRPDQLNTTTGGLHLVHAVLGVVVVDVTDGEDAVRAILMVTEMGAAAGDAATADDDVVEGLARGNEASTQHMAGQDGETDGGNGRFTQEGTTGQSHGAR